MNQPNNLPNIIPSSPSSIIAPKVTPIKYKIIQSPAQPPIIKPTVTAVPITKIGPNRVRLGLSNIPPFVNSQVYRKNNNISTMIMK